MNALSPGPRVVTFGCRLNAAESEAIRGHAIAAGLSDAVIVNTCAVTAEAERQARQTIRRLRRQNPGGRIVVTGCAAQIDPARFAAMPEVDRVIGNREKVAAATYRMAIGTELLPEAERLCGEIAREFPRSLFFAGKLIFEREGFWQRVLHNESATQLQRQLQFAGLNAMVLPVRVHDAPAVRAAA